MGAMPLTKRSYFVVSILSILVVAVLWAGPVAAAPAAGVEAEQDPAQSNDPILLQRLGVLYLQENQPREAIRALEQASALMPENGETHMWLGFAYFLNQQFDDAEESYVRALLHNPDQTDAHNFLGLLHAERGDTQKALNEFEIALADPAYPPVSRMRVNYNLGKLYFETDQPDVALTYLQQAVELARNPADPTYGLVYLMLGKVLRQIGRNEEAVVSLERVLEGAEQNPEAHLELGLAYRDQSDYFKAREHLSRVVQLAPGSPFSERARAALAQIPG
jgi:Tfp pilus assembly protein PilF